jgi:hypothetical protein
MVFNVTASCDEIIGQKDERLYDVIFPLPGRIILTLASQLVDGDRWKRRLVARKTRISIESLPGQRHTKR